MPKPLVFVGENEDAYFYVMIGLEIDLRSILGHFWRPSWDRKGSQDRPRQAKTGQDRPRQAKTRLD